MYKLSLCLCLLVFIQISMNNQVLARRRPHWPPRASPSRKPFPARPWVRSTTIVAGGSDESEEAQNPDLPDHTEMNENDSTTTTLVLPELVTTTTAPVEEITEEGFLTESPEVEITDSTSSSSTTENGIPVIDRRRRRRSWFFDSN